ncbi:MAG: heavy metal translocating P-type ATPase [Thermomicrobiales bacterium]
MTATTTPPGTTLDPVSSASARCRLDVTGMDCGDCAKTIEASLASLPGVETATVNFARGTADVAYDDATTDRPALVDRVKSLGYDVRDESPPASAGWLFDVGGMDCGDCAKSIEAGVRQIPGLSSATISFATGTLTVAPADDRLTHEAVIVAVEKAGYRATTRDPSAAATDSVPRRWWRSRRVIETSFAAVLWLVGFGLERAGAPLAASAIPFLAAMVLAGYPVARAGWYSVKVRRADMNLLMTIAAVGAVAIGRWDEGSSVLILFAIGLTLQNLTLERTRRAIQALVTLTPAEATVTREGNEQRVPVAQVAVGELVLVRPGERVPVDGVVEAGRSSVDQATITGESIPVDVGPDGPVFAGSINGDGALDVRTTKLANDTTLARIIHLVEEAQASRAPAQAFVDRFAAVYTPIVIVAAILIATAVPLVVGDFRDWVFKALVLLVVACPCALVISTPVALVAAIGSASRRGVLFKGGAAIEALAAVRAVAFDKTGTLTAGKPAVTNVLPTGRRTAEEVLARAAAVERLASHPLARAIVEAARAGDLALPNATEARSMPGRGARATVDGEVVLVGSRRLFDTVPSDIGQLLLADERDGKTAILVGTSLGIEGIISVADPLREQSPNVVRSLTKLGLRVVMLTGDNRHTAARIGGLAGVTDVRADLLPEDKVTAVQALQGEMAVAMVGDGVNDAPALATANVGIAMGVGGTDAAIEAADVALIGDDLAQVPVAVRLARKTMAIIRQNIAASLLVKAVFLALIFLGVTNLWLAVLADTGMALLVTFNSLRLLRAGPAPASPARSEPGSSLDTAIHQLAGAD